MVIFVTNCYENLGGAKVIALLLGNRDFLTSIFSCNYINCWISLIEESYWRKTKPCTLTKKPNI